MTVTIPKTALPAGFTVSAADGPVPTYIDLLRVTGDTIARGLAK